MTSYNLRKRTNPVSYSDEAASQLKLTDLAKVVRLPIGTTSVCFSAESVLAAKEILDSPSSSPEKVPRTPLQACQDPSMLMHFSGMHAQNAVNCSLRVLWLIRACQSISIPVTVHPLLQSLLFWFLVGLSRSGQQA